MRLDSAFFVYFSFLWYRLPSIVSHLVVCAFFRFFKLHVFICEIMTFLYGVFHCSPHSVLTCNASHFISAPNPRSMHWHQEHGAQCLNACVTQRNHQTDAVVPVTHYIRPSPKNAHFSFLPKHRDSVGELSP